MAVYLGTNMVNMRGGQAGSLAPTLQSKTYIVDSAGTETITADGGYDGLSSVQVSVPQADPYIAFANPYFFTESGSRRWNITPTVVVDVSEGDTEGWIADGFLQNGITYEVDAVASNTTITPTESAQTIGGANYMMEGAVTVNAISSTYVGSGITQRSSTDLTVSGATVSAPAGYYSEAASKSVSSMTLPTTAASSATSGYTSKATISRSTSAQYINIPPGYNSTGAYYIISAVANGSATAPASISGTSATISTGTNTLTLTKTISVTPTVSAGYVSSGTAGNSSVSLTASVTVNPTPTASGATVTIPAGYYSSQTTKSVTSGSATAPATISGTSATVSTGTNTLTLTKTVSVTPTVSAGYVSSGTAGNSSVSLTASVTTKAAATITPTTSNQTIAAGTYLTGAQTIAGDSNLVASNIKKNVPIFGVTGTYEGSGGGEDSGMTVATATQTLSSAASDIVFTGLAGEPTSFVVLSAENLTVGTPSKIAVVAYDGSTCHGQLITNTSNAQVSYTSTGPYFTYSNGTLAIVGSGADFEANTYKLVYTYGGISSNIDTTDVQVGSGATSITFTGLTAEPDYFSCIFKSNFSTSSGYQRAIAVVYDGTSVYGLEMDSGAHYSGAHWSYTYTNGSLTITSQSTNAGGYFHQPGYYQLTYGIGGTIAPINIEVEPLSVTQNGTYTAPSGKAYSPVTVAVSGGGGANIDTKSVTNSSNQNTSISFTSMKGEPKAFFARCTATLSRSSSNTYYYITDMVYDGDTTKGNMHARSNGQYSNITSGYSWSYSGTTLTLTSSGARNTSPGSFYNSTYELVYIY